LERTAVSKPVVDRQRFGLKGPRDAEDCVEIGFSSYAELRSGGTKCLNVSAHQRTIQREAFAHTALDIQSQLHMAASHSLF
jgi:hypothetical protein